MLAPIKQGAQQFCVPASMCDSRAAQEPTPPMGRPALGLSLTDARIAKPK